MTLAGSLRTNFCTQIIKTAKQRGKNYTIWLKSWEIIDIGEHLLWCCIDQGSLKCWWVSWKVRPFQLEHHLCAFIGVINNLSAKFITHYMKLIISTVRDLPD